MSNDNIKDAIVRYGAKVVYDAASLRMSGDCTKLTAMDITAKTIGDANRIMTTCFTLMDKKERAADRTLVAIDGAKLTARIGRPQTPAHLKREQCNFRLSRWVRDWLVAQPDDAGPLIEAALIERHKLKPTEV